MTTVRKHYEQLLASIYVWMAGGLESALAAGADDIALIVCLGDTLTHLQSREDVGQLARDVAASLKPDGRFVAMFRDYTHPAVGDARFIPVRADANRIHTCFLEEHADHMLVHDIVYDRGRHEREGDAWRMRVSSYPKLRLAPQAAADALSDAGLEPAIEPGSRGMVQIVARAGRS